jgi:FtsZ-binding cell division protein ZapB
MDAKLKQAIDIIEDAGGFVMFPESSEDEKEIRQRTFDMEREIDMKAEQQKLDDAKEALEARNEYLRNKKTAFREMRQVFNEPRFVAKSPLAAFEEMENILLENGCDLDEMEDFIESMV